MKSPYVRRSELVATEKERETARKIAKWQTERAERAEKKTEEIAVQLLQANDKIRRLTDESN